MKNDPKEKTPECAEEHSNWIRTEWNFCPSCGIKLERPKPKELRKVLADKFSDVWNSTASFNFSELADTAIQTIEEFKGQTK